MTFHGLAQMTLKQTTFPSYVKILSLVKKIIVFQYLGLQLGENNSSITLDQMYYSETMKPIASNYDNSKDSLQSQIRKLLLMSGQTKLDITFVFTNWEPTLNILMTKITNMPITSLHI